MKSDPIDLLSIQFWLTPFWLFMKEGVVEKKSTPAFFVFKLSLCFQTR